jgi:hypothetical protein
MVRSGFSGNNQKSTLGKQVIQEVPHDESLQPGLAGPGAQTIPLVDHLEAMIPQQGNQGAGFKIKNVMGCIIILPDVFSSQTHLFQEKFQPVGQRPDVGNSYKQDPAVMQQGLDFFQIFVGLLQMLQDLMHGHQIISLSQVAGMKVPVGHRDLQPVGNLLRGNLVDIIPVDGPTAFPRGFHQVSISTTDVQHLAGLDVIFHQRQIEIMADHQGFMPVVVIIIVQVLCIEFREVLIAVLGIHELESVSRASGYGDPTMIDQVVLDIWTIADNTVGDLVIEIEGDHYFLFGKIRG